MTEEREEINNEDVKIYELSYLLVPDLTESAVVTEAGNLKSLVVDSFGGVEISGEMPKAIELAYQMERQIGAKKDKYTKAFFGWIKFELPQSKIDEVKKAVDKNDKIIRFLIIKTVREDTMAVKKVAARSGEGPAYKKTSDPVKSERPAMSEAEMDKTIEELVIQ